MKQRRMKASISRVLLVGLCFLTQGLSAETVSAETVSAETVSAETVNAEEEQVFAGEYDSGGDKGPIEATFKPRGEGEWWVTFDFKFQNQPYVYHGIATGSLTEGPLAGEVGGSGNREFRFSGSCEQGVFQGEHEETTPGEEGWTGTMVLKNSALEKSEANEPEDETPGSVDGDGYSLTASQ